MTRDATETIGIAEATALLTCAAIGAGATEPVARSIAEAAVDAEAAGRAAVGLAHFPDYLRALEAGRIDGRAEPEVVRPTPVIFLSDARGGVAHLGFDRIFEDLVSAARSFGVAVFSQRNAFTCGELGRFVDRLALTGLVALAATNGPALLAGSGTTRPIFCTNPMALAAPGADGRTLVIDQSSSSTAFVNIRRAAEAGETIPEGWALDAEGRPTTDPAAAMKGALLAFGGARGANVAMMVEVLAAGLSGATWSVDAASMIEGDEGPATGLFVLALDPVQIGAPDFPARFGAWLERIERDHGAHVPGRTRRDRRAEAERDGLSVPKAVLDLIRGYAMRG